MPSHMQVQNYATVRNEQVEIFIDFILHKFTDQLYEDGITTGREAPIQQVSFTRDDCSDVFDHLVEIELKEPIGGQKSLQIWAQTTCYKGNTTGRPEANKTYEIRETLVEALGLRRWLQEEKQFFRTVHFTLGPSAYTYGWIKLAKDHAFDLSLYPVENADGLDLFRDLATLFMGASTLSEIHSRLETVFQSSDSQLGKLIRDTCDTLRNWFEDGMPISPIADKQAMLLTQLRKAQANSVKRSLDSCKDGGAGIKARAIALLRGGETNDAIMIKTLTRLNSGNPFLQIALEAESNWNDWSSRNFAVPTVCKCLSEYIQHLWNVPDNSRLVNRRLLLRIYSATGINYVQDTNISGLTEHNLYAGEHTDTQVQAVVSMIEGRCRNVGIEMPDQLYSRLISLTARGILKASQSLETINGTNLKPSFFYVEEALSGEYSFVAFNSTNLPSPIAYHSAFGRAIVRAYQNMKVVINKATNKPVAIIKAKYFSKDEFPRRAKEEAYVGFTTKYMFHQGEFKERYPGLPLIMFVDMDTDLYPPAFAIVRLATAGWEAFFSIKDLKEFLDRRSPNQSSLL